MTDHSKQAGLLKQTGWTLVAVLMVTLIVNVAHSADEPTEQWTVFGGDAAGTRFSTLEKVNADNVQRLQPAWTYRTGDMGQRLMRSTPVAFAATPIVFADLLYLSTPSGSVIALDPESGKERWRFDAGIANNIRYDLATSRGVAAWQDPQPQRIDCARRIFLGTVDGRVIALDANSGKPCAEFGLGGSVSLDTPQNTKGDAPLSIIAPPLVTRDLVIIAARPQSNLQSKISLSTQPGTQQGLVRAYDTRTGAVRWTFIASHDAATGNNVSVTSALSWDAALGLIYLATGSPTTVDMQTALPMSSSHRENTSDLANSLIALRVKDGHVAWSKQLVHHDIWNYSLSAQPTLIDIDRNGDSIGAVVQATTMGTFFLLDRDSGLPVNEIIERAVHRTDALHQNANITQPFTTIPPLVSQVPLTPNDAWGLTFYDRSRCRTLLGSLQSEGIFTPPTPQGSVQSPSDEDGIGWAGVAIDRDKQVMVAAINRMPKIARLVETETAGNPANRSRAVQRSPLLSSFNLPCSAPPWGTLAAIDLQNNAVLWQRPLGSARGFGPWFMPTQDIGGPAVGGPIVTAGGIILIAATSDNYLRAFDTTTGRELWKGKLPASGHATPMTYEVNGRQYIVIAAGGSDQYGATRGDYVVAFTLPP